MRKVILLLLICTIPFTSLAGCFDSQEITEWAYVYSIGMEKGVTDKLRMTIQVPRMKAGKGRGGQSGGSESGQDQSDIETITIDCPTFYSGVNMVNSFLSRQLNYMHTKYLVFSESLAREGIDTYITGFIRGRQIRRQINVIIAKGSASEFLKENQTVISSSLSKKQQNMVEQGGNTGFFSEVTYGELLNEAKSYYSQPIAILAAVNDESKFKEGEGTGKAPFKTSGDYYAGDLVRKGGSKVELLGTAVFDGGKMVGELNGDETRALLMVRGEFQRGFFALEDPKNPDTAITMDIRRQKGPSIKVGFEAGKPVIDVKVFLEGDILAIQSTIDYETKELKPILEKEFEKLIKEQIDQTIKKCQNLNSDVFKFGSVAAMHFLTVPEWEKYNWLKRFKDAQVNTQVNFTIRRTGNMIKSSEIVSTEGKKGE
ncbi:MAG: Ger(x)C family spore germination protein [Clostridia bacterium]|nr:Ger(x)C family spore germination protein [Clostridia bacterium]